jgi:CheY-like chemotaxis protein
MGPQLDLILLIEDNPSDAWLFQRALKKAGVTTRVERLSTGDDAVAYLQGQAPYDNRAAHPLPGIVVLDLKLPRRSGFEVLEWVRSSTGSLRLLPIVVLSSSSMPNDVNRAYSLGANSYLTKPYGASEFTRLASAFRDYWLGVNEDPAIPPNAQN